MTEDMRNFEAIQNFNMENISS